MVDRPAVSKVIVVIATLLIITTLVVITDHIRTRTKKMYSNLNNEETLVLTQIVFRHGNKSPDTTFPTDEHKNDKFLPFGRGELTQEGRKNSFQLGKILARLYGAFIENDCSKDVLYSVSSETDRTQMTLQCVLTAMFPPSTERQLEEGLTWQPIVYNTFAKSQDKYLAIHVYNHDYLSVDKKLDSKTKNLYDYMAKHSGKSVNNSQDFFKVQNALQVQEEMGLELPEWAKEIPRDVLEYHKLDFWEDIATYRLTGIAGPLIELLTQNMLAKVKGTKPYDTRKMCLFSGHDTNTVALLSAFSSYNREYVEYCAFIAIELHRIDKEYFVKVIFQNGLSESSRRQLKLKNCKRKDDFCTLDEFISATKWLYEVEN